MRCDWCWGWKKWLPAISPFSPPPFQGIVTEKQLITLLASQVSVRTLHLPCLCLTFFISGAQLNFKPPNFRDSGSSCGGGSHCPFSVCTPVPGKWSHDCTVVQSLWQNRGESWHAWLIPAGGMPDLMPGNSDPIGAPILLVTQGIFRSHSHLRASTLLLHMSTFNPGTSPTSGN